MPLSVEWGSCGNRARGSGRTHGVGKRLSGGSRTVTQGVAVLCGSAANARVPRVARAVALPQHCDCACAANRVGPRTTSVTVLDGDGFASVGVAARTVDSRHKRAPARAATLRVVARLGDARWEGAQEPTE